MSKEHFIAQLDTVILLLRQQTLMQKQVFNSHDAALYLKCSLRHIYRLSARGKIPCYKADRRLFFNHTELQQWLLSVKKTARVIARKPGKKSSKKGKSR